MIELYKGFACLYDCNRLITDVISIYMSTSMYYLKCLGEFWETSHNLRNLARYEILIKESYRLLKFF